METPSQLISRRLSELGMSKADLAKAVGVSRTYIGMLANATAKSRAGYHRPKPEILAKLARALQVSEGELLASMGYGVEGGNGSDTYELDGVFVSFDAADDLTQDEKTELLAAVRLIAQGIRSKKIAR